MENNVWATLVASDDFIFGALTLHYRLQALNSKYELIVIVTDNVSKSSLKVLDDENIKYKIFPLMRYPNGENYHYSMTLNKFWIYELEEYDRVGFIDGDVYPFSNIDFYFQEPGEWFISCNMQTKDRINGGIFIIKPDKNRLYNDFMNYKNCSTNDEDMLTAIYLKYANENNHYLPNYFVWHNGHPEAVWLIFNLRTKEQIKDFCFNYSYLMEGYKNYTNNLEVDTYQDSKFFGIYGKYKFHRLDFYLKQEGEGNNGNFNGEFGLTE